MVMLTGTVMLVHCFAATEASKPALKRSEMKPMIDDFESRVEAKLKLLVT